MMRNLSLAVAALMCGSAALAQTATDTAPAEAPATDAATAAEPAASSPATATDTTETTTVTTSAAPMAASGSVDIAAHDANKDGALSPLEFAMHASAMGSGDAALPAEAKRERYSRASGNGAIKLLNATAADFSKADGNRDKRVDPTELAAWQSGGTATASATTTAAPAAQPITSGAGTMSPAPSTSDTGATMDSSAAPTTGGGSSTSSDVPTDDMSDDMQNSTDPSESTTTPPTA